MDRERNTELSGSAARTTRAAVKWLVQVVLLALAYFVSGRLGLLLAIPPGYATAIWPPSGIALAAVLLGGYRLLPGIWLGSFALNLGVSLNADQAAIRSAALVAGSLGMGATLQAWLAALLVRRLGEFPNPLISVRQIARFLWLGGPVGCVVAATWGVTTLWCSGAVPRSEYLFSWWTWWVGDSLGVLILTPLIVVAFPLRPQTRQRSVTVGLPMCVAFTLAIVLFTSVSAWEVQRQKADFEQRASGMAYRLQKSFDNYLDELDSVAKLYASSQTLTHDKFCQFVSPSIDRYPGFLGISWNERVHDHERAAFEEAARRDGSSRFEIREYDQQGHLQRAARRPEYVAVRYIEPLHNNERALGLDVLSILDRRAAMQRARDTGVPAVTACVTLAQRAERKDGLLVYQPVYAIHSTTADVDHRRRNLKGFVTAVLLLGDVIDASLRGLSREGMIVRIEAKNDSAGPSLLYATRGSQPVAPDEVANATVGDDGFEFRVTYKMAGEQWSLRFHPTREYLAGQRSWQPWLVLASGLLFAHLLGAFLLVVTGHNARTEEVVAVRTSELARSNAELEQFAYVASHDLREPLRLVQSFCGRLKERYRGKLDERADRYIDFAVDGAVRMQRLVDDLLEYSRVGRSSERFERVELSELVERALQNLHATILESRACVTVGPLPTVEGDAARLCQVMQNLIGNAIKFRREERPVVHITARREGEFWQLTVADNGIGIEPQYFERVFVVFQRLHTADEYPGTGIGLALCKRIVELHGGRIGIESQFGHGTSMHFTLPAGTESPREVHEERRACLQEILAV